MRALLLSTLLLAPTITACTEDGLGDEGGAELAGQDEKGDAIPGIEVQARLEPGTVNTTLTTLNNSAYQRARAELGLGYSPASWTTWVNAKAATPLDGALAFTKKVKQLGGRVVFVSNRTAAECASKAERST